MTNNFCSCELSKQEPVVLFGSGLMGCLTCNKQIDYETNTPTEAELSAAEEEKLQRLRIKGRSAKHNREIAESLVDELAAGRKYAKALKKGNFAAFSIIGTNDWEDYASLSISALQLLAVTRIDENLEKLINLLEKKE
jgi:hypothetical protein